MFIQCAVDWHSVSCSSGGHVFIQGAVDWYSVSCSSGGQVFIQGAVDWYSVSCWRECVIEFVVGNQDTLRTVVVMLISGSHK